jgi:hypothetical protein
MRYLPCRACVVGVHKGARALDCFCAGEQTAVYGIDDRLSGDLSAAKESTVETLDGVLAALDSIELEIDIALRVGI